MPMDGPTSQHQARATCMVETRLKSILQEVHAPQAWDSVILLLFCFRQALMQPKASLKLCSQR